MSLSTLWPSTTFLPISWLGSGGLGTKESNVLNKWSNTCTMLASPMLHVSKYSISYFLANAIASTLDTGLTNVFCVFGFVVRSTIFPTSSLIGVSQFAHSYIHYSIFSKLDLLAMLNIKIAAVEPLTYLLIYLWWRSLPGISKYTILY